LRLTWADKTTLQHLAGVAASWQTFVAMPGPSVVCCLSYLVYLVIRVRNHLFGNRITYHNVAPSRAPSHCHTMLQTVFSWETSLPEHWFLTYGLYSAQLHHFVIMVSELAAQYCERKPRFSTSAYISVNNG
jgi:hypothetical protein